MFSPDPRVQAFWSRVESPEAWHRAELRAQRSRPWRWWHRLRPARPVPAGAAPRQALPMVVVAGLVAYAAAAGLLGLVR